MAGMSDLLKSFVSETAKKVVDKPNEVVVESSVTTKAVIIQIQVAKTDCGKIIGRKGRTIEALKLLCSAIKNTNFPEDSRKVNIEVLEDENSKHNYKMED
jgi:hypothetical protein